MHGRVLPPAAPLCARRAARVLTLTRGRHGTLLFSARVAASSTTGGQREEEDEPAQENDPSLAAEAAEVERRHLSTMCPALPLSSCVSS